MIFPSCLPWPGEAGRPPLDVKERRGHGQQCDLSLGIRTLFWTAVIGLFVTLLAVSSCTIALVAEMGVDCRLAVEEVFLGT